MTSCLCQYVWMMCLSFLASLKNTQYRVLKRLQEVDLKLNHHFGRTQVQYLGHVITPEGLKPTSSHLEAVEEFVVPKDVKNL